MIWALLEIALPLFLATLLGIFIGWLLWRWRRRSVSAANWNSRQQTSTAVDTTVQERDELSGQLSSLTRQNTTQNVQLAAMEKSTAALADQLKAAKLKIANSNASVNELAQLKQQQTQWQKNLNQSQVDKKALEERTKELATVKRQQQQDSAAAKDASSQLANVKAQVAQLDANLQQKNTQLVAATEELKTQQQSAPQTAQLESQLSRLNNDAATAEQRNKELQNSLQKMQRENAELMQEKEQLTQQQNTSSNDDVEARLQKAIKKASVAEQRAKEFQDKVKDSERDKQELIETKTHMAALQGQYRNIAKKAEASDLLEKEKNQLQSKVTELQQQADNVKGELQAAVTQKQEIADQQQRAQTRVAELETEVQRHQHSAAEQSNTQAQLETLQQQLEKTQNEATQAKQAAQKVSQLENDLARANHLSDSLKHEADNNKQAQQKLLAAEQKIAQLEATPPTHSNTEKELQGARAEIDALEAQMQNLYLDAESDSKAPPAKRGMFSAAVAKAIQPASIEGSSLEEDLPERALDRSTNSSSFSSDIKPEKTTDSNNSPKPKKESKKDKKKKNKKNKDQKQEWQQGTTSFGTPGSAHSDDLKVISGIGPVLEKTLNGFDIKSWEQIAALTPQDVKKVDEAIAFPGRIDREQWVLQAVELVEEFPVQKDRPTRKTYSKKLANP